MKIGSFIDKLTKKTYFPYITRQYVIKIDKKYLKQNKYNSIINLCEYKIG